VRKAQYRRFSATQRSMLDESHSAKHRAWGDWVYGNAPWILSLYIEYASSVSDRRAKTFVNPEGPRPTGATLGRGPTTQFF